METIRNFIGEALHRIISLDTEEQQKIINSLNNLEKTEGWRILKLVMDDAREAIIQQMKSTPPTLEAFISLKESLIAIDFLRNLPSELKNFISFSSAPLIEEET